MSETNLFETKPKRDPYYTVSIHSENGSLPVGAILANTCFQADNITVAKNYLSSGAATSMDLIFLLHSIQEALFEREVLLDRIHIGMSYTYADVTREAVFLCTDEVIAATIYDNDQTVEFDNIDDAVDFVETRHQILSELSDLYPDEPLKLSGDDFIATEQLGSSDLI